MDRSSLRRAAQLAALISTIACQETAAPSAPLPSLPDSPLYARGGGPPAAVPDGKGIGTRTYSPGPRTKFRVEYHDGLIRLGSVRVYFTFYGSSVVVPLRQPRLHQRWLEVLRRAWSGNASPEQQR